MFTDFIPREIMGTNMRHFRINEIEGITGLSNLTPMLEYLPNNTEIESILILLNKQFNLDSAESNIYDFLINAIGFSRKSLAIINADEESFYEHMTLREACEVVLEKLIGHNQIESEHGFPKELNFCIGQQNAIRISNGITWFPCIPTRTLSNYNQILYKILDKLNISDSNLLFHGTSWDGALSILNGIEIIPRRFASDFGIKNFYTTDSFTTACKSANHNNQRAVVIFVLPENYIEALEKKIIFSSREINSWRELIFYLRNPPSRRHRNRAIITAYNQYLQNVDSQDVVIGPICANPQSSTAEGLEWITQDGHIPLQFCFKETTIGHLNDFIAITVFFQSNE